jgi:hypothetical protein
MSIDELKEKIAEMSERNRRAREEAGLPPEDPEDFVGETLSFYLLEELLPFRNIFVKYGRMVTEGTYTRIDLEKLATYKRYSTLLGYSKVDEVKNFATGVRMGLSVMKRVNEAIDNGDPKDTIDIAWVLSMTSLVITLLSTKRHEFYYDINRDGTHYDASKRIDTDLATLRADPERLQTEIDTAWAHYESIKHLTWDGVRDDKE